MSSLGPDASPDAATRTSDVVSPPGLHDRIQTLTDVHNRLQTLRHVPSILLRPPSTSSLADFPPPFDPAIDREFAVTFSNSTPTHDFRALKDFVELVCCDKVQEALRAARASEDADQSELGLPFRRENRKRKRPQSPVGSPQPYVPSPPRSSSLFAFSEDDPPPLRAEALLEFVCEFNRGNVGEIKSSSETDVTLPKCKLAIWSRTKTIRDELKAAADGGAWKPKLTSPVVLRFVISDVLTAYVSLVFTNLEDPLVVESVTAFGPRERKSPHEQSDYLAFQGLSQHIARMIVSHPRVPVQTLMNALVSYRGLFVDRCTSCQRVLSAEGHIPPVARIWVPKGAGVPAGSTLNTKSTGSPASPLPVPGDATDHGSGQWEPRHATCVYN